MERDCKKCKHHTPNGCPKWDCEFEEKEVFDERRSKPFSNGTEYDLFQYNYCEKCKRCKLRFDGFPAFPEDGGCPTLDAMERARFDGSAFPVDDIVELLSGGEVVKYHHCKNFEER